MSKRSFAALTLAALALAAAFAPTARAQAGIVKIYIETSAGRIEAELDSARAPLSVANFLRYVDAHRYDSGRFHRTVTLENQPTNAVKIEVIQGGVNQALERSSWPPVPLERTTLTGLKHLDGTLSMARAGPETATSDFFICIGPQPELDFAGKRNADGQGFAAFGRVTRGMEIVRMIQRSPAEGQALKPVVTIMRVARLP